MNTDTPDSFDTDLQALFAGVIPAAGFEDRLVAAVRSQQLLRLVIPAPVKRAAIAAAAMLALGGVGYYGNRVLNHKPMVAMAPNSRANTESDRLRIATATPVREELNPNANPNKWDFGGGSNSAQNWSDWNGGNKNASYAYSNPFEDSKALKNGWQLNPFTGPQHDNINESESLRRTRDINKPFDAEDSILLPSDERRTGKLDQQNAASPPRDYYMGGKISSSSEGNRMPDQGQRQIALVDRNAVTPQATDLKYYVADGTTTENLGLTEAKGRAVVHGIQGQNTYAGNSTLSAGTLQLGASSDGLIKQTTPLAVVVAPPATDAGKNGEQGGQAPASAVPATQPVDDRKIIRTGTMEFEVDRFDTAQMQITKIVNELGGFVGATDSQKLPNGKVRGSISIRVAPERLDTLVLSLRALGDLKSQQITAADITKEYTDLESELAADRAMQDRLLELINGGKGSIKDLLAAENELGTWRGKIEKAEGMIRYYNGQVALSTLSITLSERDIQTPATAVETETADVGIEADDVEKARASALKAIDDAKGRIVEAELKRYDAGQLAARLVADVPPESAGAVIDQLKLLGKVARLEVHRQQTSSDGTNAVTADTPLHTERKPTRLLISIYNLANVAPRRTTNVSLAATDVESAYTALASAAKDAGGRVVTSNLDRGDPVKATGSLTLEFPPDKFELAMTALHGQGDVLKLTLTENPDTQNSTEAKQGLTVQLVSLASVPARETVQQTLATGDVPGAYQALLSAISSVHARVQSAQLNEQDRQNITAELELEVPRNAEADFDKSLAAAGGTIARTSSQSADTQGTVDSKVQLHVSITSSDHLAPRETTKLQVEVSDVDKSAGDIQAAALSNGGRVLEATVTKDHGKGTARIVLDLPLDKAGEVLQQIRGQGTVRGIDSSRDPQAPTGAMAHGQLFVDFDTPDTIVADQTGPWASVRQGLSTSVTGLLWSLQWVIVGLCLIGPWLGVGWIIWKIKSRMAKPAVK